MTYCLAIKVNSGLVFVADTRTNAGLDRVATFKKLHTFGNGKTHALVLLSSGNLATTQAVAETVRRSSLDGSGIFSDHSLYDSAQRIGQYLLDTIRRSAEQPANQGIDFSANIILGGQIKGEAPRLFHIYPQGNFIEAGVDTPFLQIGEEKYGKPLLDRIIRPDTRIDRALICALLSFDFTMKSNLSVDMPLDTLLYSNDSFDLTQVRRIERDDQAFLALHSYWDEGLKRLVEGFDQLQPTGVIDGATG